LPKTNSPGQQRALAGATPMLEWMGDDGAAIFGY
jgi:hypothetical protein